MIQEVPTEIKVLMNHIYEYQKGVRPLVLYTLNRRYADHAMRRLDRQGISYIVHPAGAETINLFFGRRECLEAIRLVVTKPLSRLTPEEDFMLGALLGYDIRMQCERYCQKKHRAGGCTGC